MDAVKECMKLNGCEKRGYRGQAIDGGRWLRGSTSRGSSREEEQKKIWQIVSKLESSPGPSASLCIVPTSDHLAVVLSTS